jgi:hypothetical protein
MDFFLKSRVLSKELDRLFVSDNGRKYFSLIANADYAKGMPCVNTFEKKVVSGDLQYCASQVELLRGQFEAYRAIVRLARKFFQMGGEVRITGSYERPYRNIEGREERAWTTMSLADAGDYPGIYMVYVPYSVQSTTSSREVDLEALKKMDKWMLWASRLLRDWEVRCKKHPMYKET